MRTSYTLRSTLRLALGLGALVTLAASGLARAEEGAPRVDDALRAKLLVLSDGKDHLVAVVPYDSADERLFYSPDGGKTFYAVPVRGGGSERGVRFGYVFVDPRYYVRFQNKSEIELRDGKYTVTCGDRSVALTPLDADKAKAILGAAKFERSPRKHRAYALVRDAKGNYYYVDRGYWGETDKSFRLFAGPKGALKPLKMTNVVSDSEGDIFATKTGSLRLILGRNESSWVRKGKPEKLTIVPLEENAAMIYNELGVYTGARMGTPCDDL